MLRHGRTRSGSAPRGRLAWVLAAAIAALAAVAVLPAHASADDDILAFHDDLRLQGEGSLRERADVARLDILAPEGQNQIVVEDKECGDGGRARAHVFLSDGGPKVTEKHIVRARDCGVGVGHVPRGKIVVSFRVCELGARPFCGPPVLGPRNQG